MSLNADFETEFDLDESSDAILRVNHDGMSRNREKITADDLRSTGFKARLTHVQYGTYNSQPAVLLRFKFEFRYRNESVRRFKRATIKLTLEETKDESLKDPEPRKYENDPHIVIIGPVQVCGEVKTEDSKRTWNVSVPIQYENFGVTAGPEFGFGEERNWNQDHRMWINGYRTSDDDHYKDNEVTWDTQENKQQGSGILHYWSAALVALLPSNPPNPVKLKAVVQPTIAWSINPLRLKSKNDDPVYLDRVTGVGDPICSDKDFNASDFPWSEVFKSPTEYSNTLSG